MHIPFSAQKRDVLRHRRKEAVTGKTSGKSCLPVKKCCRKPLALSLNCEKFVKNRQRMIWRFRGILERNGNGSSISQYHHTGGCHAGKSRDMRRQHIETSRFISGGNGRPAPPCPGGRRRRPGKTHRRKSAAGSQRDQAFFQQQRKYGRSFSDWLHWAYKSN